MIHTVNEVETLNGIVTKPAGPIMDCNIRGILRETVAETLGRSGLPTVPKAFTTQYVEWINQSKTNKLHINMENYAVHATQAVTQSIEAFLMQWRTRRFRVFRGEYFASRALLDGFDLPWQYLTADDPLVENDAVIISAPFSASGDIHPEMMAMCQNASELHIPVFVDAAFWGICHDIELDLLAPCIDTVAFSLSKTFWLNGVRIGLQFSRSPARSIALVNERGYINRLGAVIATTLMERFGPDYIPDRYREKQEQLCQELNLQPSKTIIFGIGDATWDCFDRDQSGWNRVCLNRILSAKD